MPRGPGKKENYNLNYSRFDLEALDGDDDVGAAQPEAAEAPLIPPEMMQHLPGELREAYRLMHISKQTGDQKAYNRAVELATAAVEKGGPEVKKTFTQHMAKEMAKQPKDVRDAYEAHINEATGSTTIRRPKQESSDSGRVDELSGSIKSLEKQMLEGKDSTRKQLDALKAQQDALESIQSPEDFFKFMHSQGLSEEDMQKAFSGDESLMQQVVQKALNSTDDAATQPKGDMNKTLDAVDTLHKGLMGDDVPDGEPAPAPSEKPKPRKEAPTPTAEIAEHRVQYKKDDDGKIVSVDLVCELPGVESMAGIDLDISEKYMRLRTTSPAFVVNAGPFLCAVDASAARAKFSKKKAFLSISIPRKA